MKKVVLALALLIGTLTLSVSCEPDQANNTVYEIDSPDKDKVDPPGGNN